MRYRLTVHAREQLEDRGIPLSLVEEVLETPQQIVEEKEGRRAYQSIVRLPRQRQQLLRLIVAEEDPLVVITVYLVSKIDRYWRAEE